MTTRPFPDPSILQHPNIPKPLHGLNPRTLLGQSWWDKQRQRAYLKHMYHCHACGIHKDEALYRQYLEAHEYYDIDYARGRMQLTDIVALCYACHNFIHSGRLYVLLLKGEIPPDRFILIMERGFANLMAADLRYHHHSINVAIQAESYFDMLGIEVSWDMVFFSPENMPNTLVPGAHNPDEGNVPWGDWRLVIDGKEYAPLWKTFSDWAEHYANLD